MSLTGRGRGSFMPSAAGFDRVRPQPPRELTQLCAFLVGGESSPLLFEVPTAPAPASPARPEPPRIEPIRPPATNPAPPNPERP